MLLPSIPSQLKYALLAGTSGRLRQQSLHPSDESVHAGAAAAAAAEEDKRADEDAVLRGEVYKLVQERQFLLQRVQGLEESFDARVEEMQAQGTLGLGAGVQYLCDADTMFLIPISPRLSSPVMPLRMPPDPRPPARPSCVVATRLSSATTEAQEATRALGESAAEQTRLTASAASLAEALAASEAESQRLSALLVSQKKSDAEAHAQELEDSRGERAKEEIGGGQGEGTTEIASPSPTVAVPLSHSSRQLHLPHHGFACVG